MLISSPEVSDHRQIGQFRARISDELIGRAVRRAKADDIPGAIDDLALAERLGLAPDVLAATRLQLAEHAATEICMRLDAGDPARALDEIDALNAQRVSGPQLRRLREAAEAWQTALADSRRGEFHAALESLHRAERLIGDTAGPAISAARAELESRQQVLTPRVNRLIQTLAMVAQPATVTTQAAFWSDVLAAAEAILELAPEHSLARQSRSNAWQRIAAISPMVGSAFSNSRGPLPRPAFQMPEQSPRRGDEIEPELKGQGQGWANPPYRGGSPAVVNSPKAIASAADGREAANGAASFLRFAAVGSPTREAPARSPSGGPRSGALRQPEGPGGRMLLWVDSVGGFLVCFDDRVVLGRASVDSRADVQFLGDLSRDHAVITRAGDAYILEAHKPTFLNGKPIESAPLRDRDIVRLGSSVELEFRQPSPMSATARLKVVSQHRLPQTVNAVILMAETCILASTAQAHIPAPGLSEPVVLYRQGGLLWCRAAEPFEVDGRISTDRAALAAHSNVLGSSFSFSLEPLDAPTHAT